MDNKTWRQISVASNSSNLFDDVGIGNKSTNYTGRGVGPTFCYTSDQIDAPYTAWYNFRESSDGGSSTSQVYR